VRHRRTMSRKAAKKQRASATKPRRNNAPTPVPPASSTLADLQQQVSALTRELAEAQEQQTATAEILRTISSSPTVTERVLDVLAQSASHLCGSVDCSIYRRLGDRLLLVSQIGPIPQGAVGEFFRSGAKQLLADRSRTA
jgi:hypothetical protein